MPAPTALFNRLIAGASVVNGVPQTPAAREDTAIRPWRQHEVTVREDTDSVRSPGWYVAECADCDWTTTGSESVVEVAAAEHEDDTDRHRADTLRPSGPLAPIKTDTEEA